MHASKFSKFLFEVDRMALGEDEVKLNVQNRDVKQIIDYF